MPDKPGTELAPFEPSQSAFPVLFESEGEGSVAQILADNFGDEGFSPTDLDRIKVPSGGGTAWDIPDEEPSRKVEGVIIHRQPTRSFWFTKRGENGEEDDSPPDCYSNEAKMGVGAFGPGSTSNPSGECASCPMNVFGSSINGSGKGKACKEQMQVFVLQEEAVLPIQISLPPTSLRGFKQYMTRLASKGKSFMSVVTAFTLKVEKANGQTFSVVETAKVRELDKAEAIAARSYGQMIGGVLAQAHAARIEAQRAAEAAEGDGPVKADQVPEAVAARDAQG